jgi:hypothetical protein
MVTGGAAFVGLCLLAAAAYGLSDFAGGLASRRSQTLTTLLYGDGIGLAVTAVLLPACSLATECSARLPLGWPGWSASG